MALPDVTIKVLSAATPASPPTNTAQAFIVGVTSRGPTLKPRLVRSMADFALIFGPRIATTFMWDWAETYFNEGGSILYVSRVYGSGAAAAKLALKKSSTTVLTVEAGQQGEVDPGLWGNELKIAVVAVTGGYKFVIELEGVIVEESPTLVTNADAIAWAKTSSNYVVMTVGAEAEPPDALAAKALSSGTAGSAVADADFIAAAVRIPRELGPGQIASPGQTAEARQLSILAHARLKNRFALVDLTDTATSSTLVTAATALQSAPEKGRRYGQAAAPWDIIPGLTSSTTRTVPPSARLAAEYARIDAEGNPNQAAFGKRGLAQYVVDLSQAAWTDAQRLELNNVGVAVSRRRYGARIATWGLRTLADQVNDVQWSEASSVRTVMAFVARAEIVGEEFEGEQVDGFGHTLAVLQGDLTAICQDLLKAGALFGRTAEEAFKVNVGEALNPPAALQEGIAQAQVQLRVSPSIEALTISVVRTPITQALI